jgi:hypothetical protein
MSKPINQLTKPELISRIHDLESRISMAYAQTNYPENQGNRAVTARLRALEIQLVSVLNRYKAITPTY